MDESQDIPKLEGFAEDFEFVIPPTPTDWGRILTFSGLGILLLVVAVLGVWYWRRRYHRVHALRRPQRMALRKLKDAFGKWKTVGYVPFLLQVTSILRVYLFERFALGAPMLTTGEISEVVRDSDALTPENQKQLLVLLEQCDLLKFASRATAEAEIEQIYKNGRDFVHATLWRK